MLVANKSDLDPDKHVVSEEEGKNLAKKFGINVDILLLLGKCP